MDGWPQAQPAPRNQGLWPRRRTRRTRKRTARGLSRFSRSEIGTVPLRTIGRWTRNTGAAHLNPTATGVILKSRVSASCAESEGGLFCRFQGGAVPTMFLPVVIERTNADRTVLRRSIPGSVDSASRMTPFLVPDAISRFLSSARRTTSAFRKGDSPTFASRKPGQSPSYFSANP